MTSIGYGAFSNCGGLTSVTIPNSVTSTGGNVFSNCSNLTSIHISDLAWWCNTNLGDLELSNNVHLYLGNQEITNLVIPFGTTTISSYSFRNCAYITSVTIPNSVTSIGGYAFDGCSNLTSITIPNSVTSIGRFVFNETAWYDNQPDGLVYAGKVAYKYKGTMPNNTNIVLEEGTLGIAGDAFSYCSGLTSVSIPNSVTSIGSYSFSACTNLTSVSIPNSLTSIGDWAFSACPLTSVKVEKENPIEIISSVVFSNRTDATLYVPVGSKAAYLAADYWKQFKEIKEFIEGDVNMDGETDVVDVVDIARFVVGTPAETFVKVLADINSDGGVDIGDAVTLVNDIAGDQNFARAYNMPKNVAEGSDELTLTESSNGLSLCLANQRDYTAFQFDLYVPEETDVMQMQLNKERKQKHQLLYNKVEDGHWRVVALSTSNRTFAGNDGELLNLTLNDVVGNVTVRDIIFFDTMGNSHPFSDISLATTTKTDLATSNPQRKEESVYTLDGRRINGKPSKKGIYIINGKKFIMK